MAELISPPNKETTLKKKPSPKTCLTCKHGSPIVNTPYVQCMVDLPPHVRLSDQARRYRVHKSYSCALWTRKGMP